MNIEILPNAYKSRVDREKIIEYLLCDLILMVERKQPFSPSLASQWNNGKYWQNRYGSME